ncbi:MAG: hypothetical protein OEW67_05520 [Cyclobacteriaceae bacterium]|nr:hypothetical protein [Cyclobacteriaceae bacterium]
MKNTCFILSIVIICSCNKDSDNSIKPSNTKLIGVGTLLGGSVFTIYEDGSNPEKWVDFDYTNGKDPVGSLVESNGKYWGMTLTDEVEGWGVIYSIDLNGQGYTEVHNFDYSQGSPKGSLIESNEKLWGMTWGGSNNNGIIFNMDVDGTNFVKVHEFDGVNGSHPTGSLVEFNGKLWGMTGEGGSYDVGVIFNLDMDGTNYEKLHDFDVTNGANPFSNLLAHKGKLWGMTSRGGVAHDTYSGGVIFSLDMNGINFMKVHDFDITNGSYPQGGLVMSNNKLWGLTTFGGSDNSGVIFSLDVEETIGYTKIHDFELNNGGRPYGSLVESNSNLYGIRSDTPSNSPDRIYGRIFKLHNDGTNFSIVYDLDPHTMGGEPSGSLIAVPIK